MPKGYWRKHNSNEIAANRFWVMSSVYAILRQPSYISYWSLLITMTLCTDVIQGHYLSCFEITNCRKKRVYAICTYFNFQKTRHFVSTNLSYYSEDYNITLIKAHMHIILWIFPCNVWLLRGYFRYPPPPPFLYVFNNG